MLRSFCLTSTPYVSSLGACAAGPVSQDGLPIQALCDLTRLPESRSVADAAGLSRDVALHADPPGHPAPRRTQAPAADSALTFITRLSHYLACAELDELASVAREVEFALLHRFHAAQQARNPVVAFWRTSATTAAGLVRGLENESELRRARRLAKPDVRARAAGEPYVKSAPTQAEYDAAQRETQAGLR